MEDGENQTKTRLVVRCVAGKGALPREASNRRILKPVSSEKSHVTAFFQAFDS